MRNLKFYKENHKYELDGKRLSSVSHRVKEAFPPFPRYAIARNCARKRGCSMQTVLDEWNKASRDALYKGSVVHQYACDRIMGRKSDLSDFPGYTKAVDDFLRDWGHHICGSEVIVCDEHTAGTVDVVCQENGIFSLMDFKTSKEILKENPYNNHVVVIGNKRVADANYWKYSLQMSWYAKLWRSMFSCEIEKIFIVHLLDGEYVLHRGYLFDMF